MKILVLGGGLSPEREVSLRSAKAVADAAKAAGFEVHERDPAGAIDFLDNLALGTIVFPILHGAGGEDGVIQKELEKRKLAYLGTDSSASAECFDKWKTRIKLGQAGIPMPKAALVNSNSYLANDLSARPHVLKVVRGGSSIGTLIVRNPSTVNRSAVDDLFNMDNEAVLEELIEGAEITVPVLGGQALPVIEIKPPKDGEFDYENKYNGTTQELCPPESISSELQQKAQVLAEQVHALMGCRHLSRVDIMVDQASNLYVLEINTMPGLTGQSLYPKSAAVAGYDMPALVKKFVSLVEQH